MYVLRLEFGVREKVLLAGGSESIMTRPGDCFDSLAKTKDGASRMTQGVRLLNEKYFKL